MISFRWNLIFHSNETWYFIIRLENEKKTLQKSHMAKTKMMLNNQKELEDSLNKMSAENADLQKQVRTDLSRVEYWK